MKDWFAKKVSVGRLMIKAAICVTVLYSLLPMRFAVKYEYVPNDEIELHLVPSSKPNGESCPLLPKLAMHYDRVGKQPKNYDQTKFAASLKIKKGGSWMPDSCKYVHNVAIIVPYRGRFNQLSVFLQHIHPFLQKQLVSYRIFVIEQTFFKAFNRGLLLNVGFVEALKIQPFHCFIFHDVDLLPLVEMNMYACTYKPRHLSAAIDAWRYKLKYLKAFGGVIAILQNHFYRINGFSNKYFGWGGEDDDLMERLLKNNLGYCRFSPEVSMYHMLQHKPEKKNPNRIEILQGARSRITTDGLNSLNYTKLMFDEKPLYTHILVDI